MIPGCDQQPDAAAAADAEPTPAKGPIAATPATPLSLVVSNVNQTGCSPTCLHEKRIIRRELQKWGKNVVYLVGKLLLVPSLTRFLHSSRAIISTHCCHLQDSKAWPRSLWGLDAGSG